MGDLYGGADMARVMYGQNARHVPAYLYVQDQGPGTVSFVGSSMTPGQDNPLRYGARHWEPSAMRGYGISQFLTSAPDIEEMISGGQGELVVGTSAQLAEIVHRYRTGAWREG